MATVTWVAVWGGDRRFFSTPYRLEVVRMETNRRDFNKLLVSAVGGIMAGVTLGGCKTTDGNGSSEAVAKHACKGLNACKGQGKDAKNSCKGQGGCATAEHHSCKSQNECKGQGGCKTDDNSCAGKNSCKGKGGCAVPVKS